MSGGDMTAPAASFSDSTRARSHSESGRWGRAGIRLTVDLVAAARRLLSFLSAAPSLLPSSALRRSIRRYEDLWMPLAAELAAAESAEASSAPMLLPPPDVHWIWLCHCFDHAHYREYCASKFGALVDRPVILDEENEDYAMERCREIWDLRYPPEPFDLEASDVDGEDGEEDGGELFDAVSRYRSLCSHFADPFVRETVYLVSARRRYLDLLHLAKLLEGGGAPRLVPTADILLMWLTHQGFPASYARDTVEMGDVGKRLAGFGSVLAATEVEETRRAWEEAFDEPYERAGAAFDPPASAAREAFNWEAAEADINRQYQGLQPRFLMEVYVFLKQELEDKEHANKTFTRLRSLRCHRSLKIDSTTIDLPIKTWKKIWHLYCEFSTRGIAIELQQHKNRCLRSSKSLNTIIFSWNDLLHSATLGLIRDLDAIARAMVSVTPPVQAPYLLKCVPDRVTDDSGAMVSDMILRMKGYRPQEGRWLSRTALDHGGRECFVIRIRVGRGIWRRGAETPTAVKWEERIIEVREGTWSYIASSVGYAPEKVVGTATPKREDPQAQKIVWHLSNGCALFIQWDNHLSIKLEDESSTETAAHVLRGRRLQYQVKKQTSSRNNQHEEEEEQHYFTLVRTSAENPEGKATALLNWKLLAVEFSPEEDAVLVLLVCMAIGRTLTEIGREDAAGLLIRRRMREVRVGQRDWGSVILPSSSSSSCTSSHLQPWYRNAAEVLASAEASDGREAAGAKYLPADGKDVLYRQALIP